MRAVPVEAGAPYQVYVGTGVISLLPRLLGRCVAGRRVFLAADIRLPRQTAAVTGALRRAGWTVEAFAMPEGEKAKTLKTLESLYGFLIQRGAGRREPLLALGGGAVGDAAGFAAATYFRGVPLVHIPTTVLAQVDSSVGGKTAVNHPLAKNAVGAFHQPAFVLAETAFLKTLPRREVLSGLAEVVKYALVFDPAFGRWLERSWERLLALRPAEVERAVAVSVRWKARCVAADERDLAGKRELLNFGHTLGHALEAAAGFGPLRHGEAVAWGMAFALELSYGRGWLGAGRALAESLLSRLVPPPWPAGIGRRALLEGMSRDKKVAAGRAVFVLLEELGRPARVSDVSADELHAAFDRLARRLGRRIP